jgi:hypothetical protein
MFQSLSLNTRMIQDFFLLNSPASNMALQLSIPPQGHRCRIETPTRRRACS